METILEILRIYSLCYLSLGIMSFCSSGIKDRASGLTFVSLVLMMCYILLK